MRLQVPAIPVVIVAVAALLAQTLAIGAGAASGPVSRFAPGNAAFQRTWARTDQPVLFGQVSRTWMWGLEANTIVMQESYVESPGGMRDVQYYDKSRMELTHPDAVDDGVWYVTNGLLVVEMMNGQMQVGDNAFVPRAPAMVNVAGDADDPLGPTYATFAGLRASPALADGTMITQRVDRAGMVTNDPALATHGVTAAHRVTVPGIDHQVAAPFWEFMNSSGLVFENGQNVQAPLFQNPYYATGYPLTEAYWADVKVGGTYRLVLSQCFERRCLTYTPGNPPGFVTEAGNVGQHYYTWRYEQADASAIVINEVLYWPEDGDLAWLELYNRSADTLDLSGWTISNGVGSIVAGLPSWQMPGGSYLVVRFGAGANDPDFADGVGTFYTGAGSAPFFTTADVALYAGAPGVDTIVDFVGWSYDGGVVAGPAYDHAVAAGIWPAGAAFDSASGGTLDAVDGPPHPLMAFVSQGMSIGRDAD
ncbi:MAG TPA: lamin tail domain-containing protein, partial [Thermomicrobiales bacterium]|nr:lamin tail domain-containing protein [Thermomicrobiales bacterium]